MAFLENLTGWRFVRFGTRSRADQAGVLRERAWLERQWQDGFESFADQLKRQHDLRPYQAVGVGIVQVLRDEDGEREVLQQSTLRDFQKDALELLRFPDPDLYAVTLVGGDARMTFYSRLQH